MAYLFGTEISSTDFICEWGEKALARYEKEKILPSLVICQAIQESGWGTSSIAKTLYNYHGMNYYDDSVTKGYDFETRTTKQERNGILVESKEQFCKFDNINEELDCIYKWYNRDKPAYKALHGNINPFKNFELIKEAGYATDSGYTDALTRIYNQFPLIAEYDTKALNSQATTQHLYFVQVGAYTIKSNADTMLNRVKKAGFDAFVKEADGYYKVQVGAYSVKSNATTQLAKVKDAGFDAFIAEGDI